jgi:hypothetical protein
MIWLIIESATGLIGGFLPRTDDSGKITGFDRLTISAGQPEIP